MPVKKTSLRVRQTPIQRTMRRVGGTTFKDKNERINAEIERLHKMRDYFEKRKRAVKVEKSRERIRKVSGDPVYIALNKLFDVNDWERSNLTTLLGMSGVTLHDAQEAIRDLKHRKMKKDDYEWWAAVLNVKLK